MLTLSRGIKLSINKGEYRLLNEFTMYPEAHSIIFNISTKNGPQIAI